MPGDRRWAIARGGTAWNDARPTWLRKQAFVTLMRDGDEALARVACAYADDGRVLCARAPEVAPIRADLRTEAGREALSAFLNRCLGPRPDGSVRVVAAGRLSLTDIPQNGLSLVNLASVAALAERIGRPVHPLRFRANVYLDGLPPWAEREWIGRCVGLGEATVRVGADIHRCNATQVDPDRGARDLDVVALLKTHFGHVDMGVYAEVIEGGRLEVGARVAPPQATRSASRIRDTAFYLKNGWILARSWLGR